MGTRSLPGESSAVFTRALHDLRAARVRPEVRLTEMPAPTRIAPHAVALTADVHLSPAEGVDDHDDLGTGRFVLLHDPAEPEPWGGAWRAVTFARAELEPEMGADPMLGAVGWSWLVDALEAHGLGYAAEGGTVTRVLSEGFASLGDRPPTVEMEVRASWTPTDGRLAGHLEAWTDVLCTIAGLPPLPDGVVALPAQRR